MGNDKGISGLKTRTPYFPELDYADSYVATLIIDSVLRSVADFWVICQSEDNRFYKTVRRLNSYFKSYEDFYRFQFPKLAAKQIISPGSEVLSAVTAMFKRFAQFTIVEKRLDALRNCRKLLVACLSLFTNSSSEDYLPMFSYCLMRAEIQGFLG